LYHRALELDLGLRAAFLDEECAGDAELRREVESLLAAHEGVEQKGDFLKQPAPEVAARAMAAEQSTSLLGRQIDRYKIISLLGRGGMGEVYRAFDAKLGREVALKLLPAEFMQDRDRVGRFEREAKAVLSLNHPNIVTIYDIGRAEGVYYIASEFIEGQTLRQRMRIGLMELREALDVAVQVTDALAEAHAKGSVHRDIKPENVMLWRDSFVKVLDFGLAKLSESFSREQAHFGDADSSPSDYPTDPGRMMGTPRYMSPEQIRGWQVDARSDIFSLGVLLYEVVAGRAPFDGESRFEVTAAILNHEPAQLQRCGREVPAELARIVHRMLAKDREQRYQSIKDLYVELKNLKDELAGELRQKLLASGSDEVEDRQTLDTNASSTLPLPQAAQAGDAHTRLEPVGGAMSLDSGFYIIRPTDEEFGLFRSWHNERALDPVGPWQQLTMAIAYATEAYLFIKDMNQSPFNVGTRLALEDFTEEQVAEFNRRYGSPLKDEAELKRYRSLVSGHPHLVHCGLQDMATHKRGLAELEAIADHEDGLFGNHLHRLVASLTQDTELGEVVRGILQGKPCPNQESFYRLRSAGVITGDSARDATMRCQLYATYLEKRLL
jgi:serine/threonine protein kinase